MKRASTDTPDEQNDSDEEKKEEAPKKKCTGTCFYFERKLKLACDYCVANKRRCDGARPNCGTCKIRIQDDDESITPCQYSERRKPGRRLECPIHPKQIRPPRERKTVKARRPTSLASSAGINNLNASIVFPTGTGTGTTSHFVSPLSHQGGPSNQPVGILGPSYQPTGILAGPNSATTFQVVDQGALSSSTWPVRTNLNPLLPQQQTAMASFPVNCLNMQLPNYYAGGIHTPQHSQQPALQLHAPNNIAVLSQQDNSQQSNFFSYVQGYPSTLQHSSQMNIASSQASNLLSPFFLTSQQQQPSVMVLQGQPMQTVSLPVAPPPPQQNAPFLFHQTQTQQPVFQQAPSPPQQNAPFLFHQTQTQQPVFQQAPAIQVFQQNLPFQFQQQPQQPMLQSVGVNTMPQDPNNTAYNTLVYEALARQMADDDNNGSTHYITGSDEDQDRRSNNSNGSNTG